MAANWFNKTVDEVESTLKTNAENGLTAEEAKKRQEEYGLNELKAKKKKSLFVKFLEQFKDFMIIILWSCWSSTRRRIYRYNYYISSCSSKCNNRSSPRKQSRKIIRSFTKIKFTRSKSCKRW